MDFSGFIALLLRKISFVTMRLLLVLHLRSVCAEKRCFFFLESVRSIPMPDLADGESVEVQGSGAKPYVLKNSGGVYSCTCPAWRNQSIAIEKRTCKHLRKLRGEAAEEARIGGALPQKPARSKSGDDTDDSSAEPPVLLAEAWDNAQDLSGWWMSEKLDGVRAYWDGKQFLSRQGNLYHAPEWFIEGLPPVPLDGELWLDRKAFQRTVSIVRRQDKSDHWNTIRFVIFDAPLAAKPFEDRIEYLKEESPRWQNKNIEILEHKLCSDLDHLRSELQRVESLGGEGLMLRQPSSVYVAGRSATLLKVKTFHDAEAEVIGHEPGKGRHQGRLGALSVRLSNGKIFSVGTGFSDKQRETPPAIGALITFRYQELSDAGIPRFPSYVGFRSDIDKPSIPKKEKADSISRTEMEIVVEKKSVAKQSSVSAKLSSEISEKRYFEFCEDGSHKFWEISASGVALTTRWGKAGTEGQSKTKEFASVEKREAEAAKLIAEKTKKGYQEQ
jgi:DNA ligase-1